MPLLPSFFFCSSSSRQLQTLLVLWSTFFLLLCTHTSKATATMSTAKWNGVVLAESSDIVEVEGNKYFPMSSLKMEYFKKASQTTNCPWKGTANYFDIVVDGKTNAGAAWYYASPKPDAANIKERVAFWKGVNVN